ncbi:MAG: GntR family transcriptional regulator, partial [Demequinaceae bacterium]|nr:GntR family transcriptional regulator [Demequinaceae bacterium]
MLIRIDASSDTALFEQVAASIRTDMAAGRVHPDDKLPSAREVAASLGVNLHTVLRAYQVLRDEGLVDMRRGRGAVVTAAAADLTELMGDIRDLGARAAALGMTA